MVLAELQQRYGAYVAELVRQALTLEEFRRLDIEELVSYFELLAERSYEEFRSHLNVPLPADGPELSHEEYLKILRRRWQQAEEMAHIVLKAEKAASDAEMRALGA